MPAPASTFLVSADGIALTAATAKTILELKTTSTCDIVIRKWWVEFDGTSSTATPVKIEVGRFSTATTTNGTSPTPTKLNYGGNSIASNVTAGYNTTTEGAGTASDVEIHRVPPTGGLYIEYSLGTEWVLGASGFWRIRCTAAAGVNATFGIVWEE